MIARVLRALLAVSALLLAWAPSALADVLPDPQRPPWNEEPAPMPEPPPDDAAGRGALVLLAALAAVGAMYRHRRLRPAPAAHREGRA